MLVLLLFYTTALSRVAAQHNLTPFGRAIQSSTVLRGGPVNAINPPISNQFSWEYCTHTALGKEPAWWMFQFSFGAAYITDIIIYYREGFAIRMDGFALYVTNTSTIPPNGYLCNEDSILGLPNITQTIPCNQLGQYVIYYDAKGSNEGPHVFGPIVELCYVSINGCEKSFWGSNCQKSCSEKCIEHHCYPGNGSCILGCNTENCLNEICNRYTAVCTNGCKARRTGSYCDKYNVASDGLFSQTPNGSHPASLANDGNKKSCSKTKGFPLIFQVDLKRASINQGVYITFGESTTKEGNHTLYASNTSTSWKMGIILYEGSTLPSDINFTAIFRYLTYVPPVNGTSSELEVCEIGIIGCPPSQYGHVCNQSCPKNCHGPCDLDTGNCTFGCLNGWTGDKCERECPNGQFGKNCLQVCEGCISSMCDPVNGLCDNTTACIPGYLYGEYCNTECANGHFGRNCLQVCEGCLSRKCDPVNGLCDNTTSCNPGYVYGKYCNQPCSQGFYGSNCLEMCSQFCLYQTCDHKTGKCIGGCVRGIQGTHCTQECPNGQFGKNCLQVCEGCISSMCDPVNGLCDNTTACIPGYLYGEYCNTECANGHFGRNCSQVCEGCLSRKCDPVNGLCDNTTSCSPGYVYGKYCNQTCSQGFYGSNCLEICSQFCLYQTCDHKTGKCIGGCVRGIQGTHCTQVSVNTDSPISTHIGLSIGCFLLGVLVTVVVCFLIMKNRQLPKEQGKRKATEKAQSPEQQHYDDIGMENISTYQDLQKGSKSNEYDQINTAYVNQ